MYFLALATDYDGTIADNDVVAAATSGALWQLKDSGRRLILVTGRELPELIRVFPEVDLFDRIVAENGALLYNPSSGQQRLLAPPVPSIVIQRLKEMNIAPVSAGSVIVSTWEPHHQTVLNLIRELGLELQIAFNKGAVMILPPNVNKASGLLAALKELDLAPQNVVAVGDAENDHAFLSTCGYAAAVANAIQTIKNEADIVLRGDHGAGVVELIEALIKEDARIASKTEHGILVGVDRTGENVYLEPYRGNILIAGPSACGKSTLATALTEQMAEKQFEFCVVDPEGDYVELEHAVCVGNRKTSPVVSEAIRLLDEIGVNLVVNMQALTLKERWRLFSSLLQQTSFLRARTGRPHWLIVDEAHELLSRSHEEAIAEMPPAAAILVTAYPQALAAAAMKTVDFVIALGDAPQETLEMIGKTFGLAVPGSPTQLSSGEVLFWACNSDRAPYPVRIARPHQRHRRHAGKYAVGDVGSEHSFYFRSPVNGITEKAENLYKFMELASSVDDATWKRHLRARDYSAWFRHVIKDEGLACDAARAEDDRDLDLRDSRRLIQEAIWQRYAAPCQA